MSFCDRHGIPHSVFLGWAPEDRAKQLAFMSWQADEDAGRCGRCGEHRGDWLDEQGVPLRDAPVKVIAEPAACACELLHDAGDKLQDKEKLRLRLRLVPADDERTGVTEGQLGG